MNGNGASRHPAPALQLEEDSPGNSTDRLLVDLGISTTNGNQTYATVSELLPGTEYSFRLLAIKNGQITSADATQSTDSPAVPDEPDYPYAAPTDISFSTDPTLPDLVVDVSLSATAGSGPDVLYVQGDQRALPEDDPYHLYNYDEGDGGFAYVNPDGATQLGFDSEAGATVQVRYALFDENTDTQVSPYTDWQTTTVAGDRLDAPTGVTATAATGGNVTLNWTASDGDGAGDLVGDYAIYGVTNAGTAGRFQEDVPADTTTATVPATNSTDGVGYATAFVKYFVIAESQDGDVGDSLYSNYANNPGQAPAAPQNLAATPFEDSSGQGIRLVWDDESDNEAGFTIQRSTSGDFSTDLQTFTVNTDTNQYTDTTAVGGVTYYYRVEATNTVGNSSYSNNASATLVLPTVSVTAIDPDADADGPGGRQDAWFEISRDSDSIGPLEVNLGTSGSEPTSGYTITDASGTALTDEYTLQAGQVATLLQLVPEPDTNRSSTSTAPTDGTVIEAINNSTIGNASYSISQSPAADNVADSPPVSGNATIRVDGNRDGTIEMNDSDQTTPQNPYWFWTVGDMPRIAAAGSDDPTITADTDNMENLAPLNIQAPPSFDPTSVTWSNWKMTLQFTPITGTPSINLFTLEDQYASHIDYLTLTTGEQTLGGEFRSAVVDTKPVQLPLPDIYDSTLPEAELLDLQPTNTANWDASTHVLHYLFSGDTRGEGALTVDFYYDNKLVSDDKTYLKLTPVQEMYEHWSVGTSGLHIDPLIPSTPTIPLTATELTPVADAQLPSASNAIVFVHGWNITTADSDTFSNTAFERLFWQGSTARFISFTWPTDSFDGSYLSAALDPGNFDRSEYAAYSSGTGLLGLLHNVDARFGGYSNVDIFAHSMGNIVVSEALRQAGLTGTKVVNTYVASQAAVPADAYDANQFVPFAASLAGYGSWLDDTTADIYDDFNPTGDRSAPGAPYFAIDSRAANKMVNFYNEHDYAVTLPWNSDQFTKPDYGGFADDSLATKFVFYAPAPNNDVPLNLAFAPTRYEAFAFAAEPNSYALGATANEEGPFSTELQVNLDGFFADGDSANFGSAHAGHSAEFYSTYPKRKYYWSDLMAAFGIATRWDDNVENIAYGGTSN